MKTKLKIRNDAQGFPYFIYEGKRYHEFYWWHIKDNRYKIIGEYLFFEVSEDGTYVVVG